MAEAILGPLLSKLQDVVVTEAKALAAVGGEIEKLGDKLMWLQALVYEADLRSRQDGSRLVRVLACQIREVAFETEDAVDQFYLKGDLSRRFGLSQRFGRNWGRAALEFVANFPHAYLRPVHPLQPDPVDELRHAPSHRYGMTVFGMGRENLSVPFELKGRKKEKDELVKKLKKKSEKSDPSDVIHVVGVGGIGKRALLTQVCEFECECKQHFPVRVRMSFPPSISDSNIIVKQIEEKLDKERSLCNEPGQDARCLVVIESPIKATTWCNVEPKVLKKAGHGSKIVMLAESISSRQEQKECIIELKFFKKDMSTTLFNHVLGLGGKRQTEYKTGMMNTIRDYIEPITNGLPLAVVLLAKLMRTKDYSEWEAASAYLRSTNEDSKLKAILSVCIDDLPDELKSCLLYTAGFPVNTVIDAHQLVRLWMAEGFLTQQHGLETEQLGQCYLKELIYRGLLELIDKTSSADGGCVESVMIHDQIHHLLRLEAQRTSFMDFHYGGCVPPPDNTRRLALYNYNDKFSDLSSCLGKLRTVVSYSDDVAVYKDHDKGSEIKTKSCKKEHTLMRKILHGSPFLRVIHLEAGLDLDHSPELPDQIGEMVHLQYLCVRHGLLEKLPSCVGNLGRLQTVDVRGTQVRELPKSLWKIKTLRHVLGDRLKFPKSTGDLKLMQTLETVTIQHLRMWCTATDKRRKQFGLRFLHRLRIVEQKESQLEELETILKDLSYLESLGLSGDDIPIDLFAGASSAVSACLDHVASLELDGKLPLLCPDENLCFSCVPRRLSSLTRLVLRRTSIKQNFIHVIAKLPTLAELEMQSGSYVGEEVVFCNHGFNSLVVLRITSLVTLKRFTVHTVTTRRNKAIEPKCFDMLMPKFNNFEPNTCCSFCNTTIITDQANVWQQPPAVETTWQIEKTLPAIDELNQNEGRAEQVKQNE